MKARLLALNVCVCFVIGLTKIAAQDTKANLILPPVCAAVLCAAPICDDYYTPLGECCPVCRDYKTCSYKGKTYTNGESFKDKCNTCHCRNGAAICTKIGCPDIVKPGVCPKPWRFASGGTCVEMCSSDYDCPDDLKCCSQGCGRICKIPTGTQTGCFAGGKRYNEGDHVPSKSSDPCKRCTCKSGSIRCEILMCPMCVGHTPPGACCPICGTFPREAIR
ncbi:kielin/chordin-like protein [Dreissena polymorpha]|uniref:Kielin/chordin-like protein n=1 Tax=Dreissena polymorpha TaxID=45954 RepID=A0A9D3YKD9_DREPO|nr:kielin/chordin-like protein [Dreissena polymorpha]KAH3700478.1 hypothetical protein DPMN_075457 [Dreissena polymorpha]